MRSDLPRGALAAFVAVVVAAAFPASATAAAHAFSRDGEATVYVDASLRGTFSIVYDASMRVPRHNASWSLIDMTLLGDAPPSDAVTIGLVPVGKSIHVFTAIARGGRSTFRDTGLRCATACRIGLHGSAASIVATYHGRVVGTWPRSFLRMPHPTMQLNGEVNARGDRLDATLAQRPSIAARRPVAPAACAFTTHGIRVARRAGRLHFAGVSAPAVATFRSLATGSQGGDCTSVGAALTLR